MATKINTPIAYRETATLGVTSDVIAPYKYQWKRDGVNLAHGNNKSYTTPPLRPEDFSAKYSVTIFGQDGIETSDEVTINADVKFVHPIAGDSPSAPVVKGTPVVKPFSAPAPASKPFSVKP